MKHLLYLSVLACTLLMTDICHVVAQTKLTTSDIKCRDPFVTVDVKNKCYYLIVSKKKDGRGGLFAYKSKDLKEWDTVGYVYNAPQDYIGSSDWWAPDFYRYKGNYYCFVTVSNPQKGILRGTTILKSKNITGPYSPVLPPTKMAMTPVNMQCLDGSFFVDNQKNPWIIFSVEWTGPNVTNKDGEIWAQRLNKNLTATIGAPHKLFKASDAPWVKFVGGYVTDAPFIWKDQKTGHLLMLWSSFSPYYTIGQAISKNGNVLGPWEQDPKPIFTHDGGHQMVFKDLHGNLKLSFHTPNGGSGKETFTLRDITIKGGKFLPVKENE